MGGGEVATLAANNHYKDLVTQVRGWILEAPFIGFAEGEEPSAVKVLAGRMASKLLPHHQLKHLVPPELLSRDPEIVQSYKDDPLCHNTGTLQGLAGLLDRTAALEAGHVKVGPQVRSLLLAHGTADKIVSYEAAVKWVEEQSTTDKQTRSYEGAFHQLHSDLCKEEFGRDLISWILERSGGEGKESEAVAKL